MTNAPDPESRARDAVQADLVKNFNVTPTNIEFLSSVPKDWPDSSLGCPRPDEFYLQVITPGYQIQVRDKATNTRYDYHTDQKGRVVMCSKQ